MAKTQCPSCKKIAAMPTTLAGRKIRCKSCNTLFTATAIDGDGTGVTSSPSAAPGPTSSSRSSANANTRDPGLMTSTAKATGGDVITVVAQRVDAPASSSSSKLWVLAGLAVAMMAFIVPILAAGGFVAARMLLKPGNDGGGPVSEAASDNNRHAGIEIGSKGVKLIILEVFPDPDGGFGVSPLAEPKTKNTSLVSGLENKPRFDDDALEDTAKAVAQFYKEATQESKVPEGNIYIVASSGPFSSVKKRKDLTDSQKLEVIKTNKGLLAEAVQKTAGKPLNFIDAEDEAERSFKGIVPRPHARDALLVDIGSGNTKLAIGLAPSGIDTAELPYGTKTYTDLVKGEMTKPRKVFKPGKPRTFANEARGLSKDALVTPLKEKADRKPGLVDRQRVYLSGGIVWALATYVHPDNRRPMTEITVDDLDTFGRLLALDRKAATDKVLGPLSGNDKLRLDAETELKKVNDTFSVDELTAGLEILRALSDGLGLPGKKLYFARFGYFGWILSYVADKGAGR